MIRLETRQRLALSETIRELANLVAAVLVLSQFVGERPPSWRLMLAGLATWFAFVWLGMVLAGDRRS